MKQVITELPLYSDPHFSYSVSLEKVNRALEFKWNSRTSTWSFNVVNDNGEVVVQGIKLVLNYPILVDYRLAEKGLTGYFFLADAGEFPSNKLSTAPEEIAQWYRLFYVYEIEE